MDVSTLDQIMSSCPNLDMLDLSGLSIVGDAMIISLADHSPKLTQLNLKGCKQVSTQIVPYVIKVS